MGRGAAPPLPARRGLAVRAARQRARPRAARGRAGPVRRVPRRACCSRRRRSWSLRYNVGGRVPRREGGGRDDPRLEAVLAARAPEQVLPALERLLLARTRSACVIEYAEAVAPAGEVSFASEADRAAVVTLHRWSMAPALEAADNLVLLVAETLARAAPAARLEPAHRRPCACRCPTRRRGARRSRSSRPGSTSRSRERLADVTAGWGVQIEAILQPPLPAPKILERFVHQALSGRGARAAARTGHARGDQELSASRAAARRRRRDELDEALALDRAAEARDHRARVLRASSSSSSRSTTSRRWAASSAVKAELRAIAAQHPRGAAGAVPDGPPLHRPDGHRQDLRRGGLRQGGGAHRGQAQELPLEVGRRDRGEPRAHPLGGPGDRAGHRDHRRGGPRPSAARTARRRRRHLVARHGPAQGVHGRRRATAGACCSC